MKKIALLSLLGILTIGLYQEALANFLIIGTRTRTAKEGYIQVNCPICATGKPQAMKSLSYRSWATFFFIPIFPYNKKKYFVVCPKCKNSFYPIQMTENQEETDSMQEESSNSCTT